jgi:hypothetical protein
MIFKKNLSTATLHASNFSKTIHSEVSRLQHISTLPVSTDHPSSEADASKNNEESSKTPKKTPTKAQHNDDMRPTTSRWLAIESGAYALNCLLLSF